MKLNIFILSILCFLSSLSQAQIIENGCIKIDFESILDEVPVSGMALGDQYLESTGVRFFLDDGQVPVLAGLGWPQEAFDSNFGPDSSPDADILGQFMLTDDGIVAGGIISPLYISFENPIDSISAVVMDLDGDEFFVVNALDEIGNIIYELRIDAGDPLTGDGLATPFGFNLPSCEGTIHMLSFKGERNDGGGFGFAMDNFLFCFEGTDLLQDLEVEVTDILCQDNPGQIQVVNNGNLNLMYSIDGNNFNTTGFFPNLTVGEYLILVEDENGCQAVLNEQIEAIGPTIIEELIVVHTSCGENNGSFEVIATQDDGVIYFIDAFDLSSSNTFTDLAPGTYPITIIGPSGCSASDEVTINPSEPLVIDEVFGIDDSCQQTIGSIEVNTTGGTGQISYSIDNGLNMQNESLFEGLTQGFYEVFIIDESSCSLEDTISLYETPGITLGPIETTETLCDFPSGTIGFIADGGSGNLQYQLNDGPLQDVSFFTSLDAGEYDIMVTDEVGCIWELTAEIELPICPIYIPNIFTPLSGDVNSEFRLFTDEGQDVAIISYEIYDRWGSRIYSSYNFDISSEGNWWKGRADGVKWSSGVYVYKVEAEYYNGTREVFTGDISLIR